MALQWQGHVFYVLTFPSANATWAYDATAGLWAQWGSHQVLTGVTERFRGAAHAFAYGKHWIGDHTSGNLYTLEDDRYTDGTLPLTIEASLPPLYSAQGLERVRLRALQFDMETGTGLDGLPAVGRDPMLEVAYSDDGGHQYTPWRAVPIGRIGATRTRVRLRRLGSTRDRRIKLRHTAPTKFALVGAYADVEA
jgi:hypothetical protein